MKYSLPSDEALKKLPKDGGPNYNRLVFEDSLYLKSHAHQKINWYSWGQDAFDLAKITDKPLFLSIGYSSCHWCHVMSSKTFDESDIADLLNDKFVSIKIDRDQYPDIDHIYMLATQLMTQHGGWPNTVFCLPTGQPFYAGTYFPPDDQGDRPGFRTLIRDLGQAWANNRDQIEAQALELDKTIKQMNEIQKDNAHTSQLRDHYQQVMLELNRSYDQGFGGFGTAPKFPPYNQLRLLLDSGSDQHLNMVFDTLTKMATSGLYDQVNGGFHRYSTDQEWHCPHFEKMLVDNAQMLECYSIAYQQKPNPLFLRIVTETIDHLMSEWRTESGMFLTSIDADSDGEEGLYYTITFDECKALFPDAKHFQSIIDYFQMTETGNMLDEATGKETGYNIFHPLDSSIPFDLAHFRQVMQQFRQDHRNHPEKDPSTLISANALLCKSFFMAASAFSYSEWKSVGDSLITSLFSQLNVSDHKYYLDDLVYTMDALMVAYQTFSDSVYLENLEVLWQQTMDRFYDHLHGGAWFTQADHRTPITRIKDIYDQAVPSPNAVFIQVALFLFKQYKKLNYYTVAQLNIRSFMGMALKSIRGCESYWLAVRQYWTLFNTQSFDIQYTNYDILSDDLIKIELDLVMNEDCYVMDKESFSIGGGVASFEWRSITISPIKSRRFEWSGEIIRCATGVVRVDAICYIPTVPDSLEISIKVCTDTKCLRPEFITLF